MENIHICALEKGEPLQTPYKREVFILRGLNRAWTAGGFNSIYATIEYGKEDWFHCGFDETIFTDDRLRALFNMFKDSEDSLWSGRTHKVVIRFSKYSLLGKPMHPVITELHLDEL